MSDREHSPARSGSYQSLDNKHMEHSPPLRGRQQQSATPPPRNERRSSFSRSRSPAGKRKMPAFRGERERGGGGGGGRGRSKTRSRSPARKTREYSRSRSRSRNRRRGGEHRSHSHSPMSSRRRHIGNRDNPNESRCVGVFGLSIYTSERELHDVFGKYGPIERVQVVIDAKTGRSRGFAFVYYSNKEDAKAAKDRCSGMEIDGRRIRVDFSITQRAHTPTPGIYMGKPTEEQRGGRSPERHSSGGSRRHRPEGHEMHGGGDRYRERDRYHNRSPSPYHGSRSRRSRYERSRSRSYSRYESRGIG